MVVKAKGPDPDAVVRLAKFLGECGLVHFTYKSDKEPALRALMREAVLLARVKGVDEDGELDWAGVQAAIPEHSSPGEAASNGAPERAIQAIEDQARVLKLA